MTKGLPLVKLLEAWFLRNTPVAAIGKQPMPVFSSPVSFILNPKQRLAIVGDTSKTDFLSVLANKYVAEPLHSRSYPASLKDPKFKTELLRFVNNGSWGHGASNSSGGFTHLSSRYEFFKDLEVDEIVENFIADRSYNSNIEYSKEKISKLIHNLNLVGLQGQFITTLSNGQFRRARIAKELYREPAILCIDDPFLGLDPFATNTVNDVLKKTSFDENNKTTIVLGFRVQDEVPKWIEHVVIVNQTGIVKQGTRDELLYDLERLQDDFHRKHNQLENKLRANFGQQRKPSNREVLQGNKSNSPIIEMKNTNISYKGKPIIKDLNWTVREGEKWHIRGRNGSGKTTLLSLITLDHPQSWNRTIKVFGVERAPGKVNYFDTNKYIGFTSPELHAIYPKDHTVFETISTGFVVGSYIRPRDNLTAEQVTKINHYLTLLDISQLKDEIFGDIPVSKQKLVLLVRAIINDPRIVILDEALSAMVDEDVIKGKILIDNLDATCLVIGHVEEEVPKCNKYILLNDAKRGHYEIGNV